MSLNLTDIDSDSDGPTATDQYISSVSDIAFQPDIESSEYQFPPPLSNRFCPEFTPYIPFEHSPVYLRTQTKTQHNVSDTLEQAALARQTDKN